MPIRVLVVDDSVFMRQMLKDMLGEDKEIEVVGIAKNGKEAVEIIPQLMPDVITLDVEMPVMDGLAVLKWIMQNKPLPVLMVSALTQKGSRATIEALQLGAVDFVAKPSGSVSLDLGKQSVEIISKVKTAARANLFSKPSSAAAMATPSFQDEVVRTGERLVAIGTSTGGPKALNEVIPLLPKNLSAGVVVVQHMPPGFTNSLALRLDSASEISVTEAKAGDKISPGKVFIAPGGKHLSIEKGGLISLSDDPPIRGLRPTVDVMMESAARIFAENTVGVILTGMGDDGARGMKIIKEHRGKTITEDESTCVIYGMPKAVIKEKNSDIAVPIQKVADTIIDFLKD